MHPAACSIMQTLDSTLTWVAQSTLHIMPHRSIVRKVHLLTGPMSETCHKLARFHSHRCGACNWEVCAMCARERRLETQVQGRWVF